MAKPALTNEYIPIYATEPFWLSVAFFLFLIIIGRPVYKFIIIYLEKKSYEIKKNIDEANKAREEAQKLLAEVKKKSENLDSEIEVILNNAEKEAKAIREKARLNAENEMRKKASIIERKIEDHKNKIIHLMKTDFIENSFEKVNKKLEKELEKDKITSEYFNDSLNQIDQKL